MEIWVAVLVAVIVSVVAPVVLSWLTNRQRRAERIEDYARQDAVADRLTKRQNEVAAQAAEAAALLLAANERVAAQTAEASEATQAQLRQIHTLVNNDMTKAIQAQYDALVQVVTMMRVIAGLKLKAGLAPDRDDAAAIEATLAQLAELGATITDRVSAAKVGEAQLESRKEK